MKQESPLRKHDKHFEAIHSYINKPTPAQIDASRRETDQCDCTDPSQCWEQCGELGHSEEHARVHMESNPIREAAQAFIGGMGIGAIVVSVIIGLSGDNPLPYVLGTVVCLLGYLYLNE